MILFYLQVITTAIAIIWFDVFGLHRKLLKAFGKNEWDDLKPFSCFFCMSFQIGLGLSLGMFIFNSFDPLNFCFFNLLNIVISRILDVVFGYESIKGK